LPISSLNERASGPDIDLIKRPLLAEARESRDYANVLLESSGQAVIAFGSDEKIVLIKADEDAPYGRVMVAMDTLRKAQVEDMGLVTERKIKPGQTGGN